MTEICKGLLLPFLGTLSGSACVFLMKEKLPDFLKRFFMAFAGGVMTSASIWSLLLPALEQAETELGRFAFFPVAGGFLTGIVSFIFLDRIFPADSSKMMMLSVTIHNIPEGMAVGIAYAGTIYQHSESSLSGAFLLALGIAVQNFPEGAIISMPLKADGMKKSKAFCKGVLSGIVEPLAGIFTLAGAGLIIPLMPVLLSFAGGAMIYVVIKELIPEMYGEKHSSVSVFLYSSGFVFMMILDVAFQ